MTIPLIAVSPFLAGYLLNYFIMQYSLHDMILTFINIAFLVYWYFAGVISSAHIKPQGKAFCICNSFGIISMVLIWSQLINLNLFLPGIIGTAPQMYFLPLVALSSKVAQIILFFMPVQSMHIIFIIVFMLMAVAYYVGYLVGSKRVTYIKKGR